VSRYFKRVPLTAPVGMSRALKTYFIQGETTRLIKIGRTYGTVAQRLRELQANSPDVLTVLAVVPRDLEQHCHDLFVGARRHNEWFAPTNELLLYIQQLADKDFS
jgi:T5orf172 domain